MDKFAKGLNEGYSNEAKKFNERHSNSNYQTVLQIKNEKRKRYQKKSDRELRELYLIVPDEDKVVIKELLQERGYYYNLEVGEFKR